MTTLNHEIDARVEFLYFHRSERGTRQSDTGEVVPYPDTYDEYLALQQAETGTIVEDVRKLIAADESNVVEFKETLEFVDRIPDSVPENKRAEWKANKQKEYVEGVLKTIAAFYNSKGGTLLIGVNDKKEIIGLALDFSLCGNKPNRDGFEGKLGRHLKRIEPLPSDLDIDFPIIDGKTVCLIRVKASHVPHFLDNRLFVRHLNSTEELTGQALRDWLAKRGVTESAPDPLTLPWLIMDETTVRALPSVASRLADGWELLIPLEEKLMFYLAAGAQLITWQSPSGTWFRLYRADDPILGVKSIWMIRRKQASTGETVG